MTGEAGRAGARPPDLWVLCPNPERSQGRSALTGLTGPGRPAQRGSGQRQRDPLRPLRTPSPSSSQGRDLQPGLQLCSRPSQPSAVRSGPPWGLHRPSNASGPWLPIGTNGGKRCRGSRPVSPPPVVQKGNRGAKSHGVLGPPLSLSLHPHPGGCSILRCPTAQCPQVQFPGLADTHEVIWFSRPGQVTPPFLTSSFPGRWDLPPLCLPGTSNTSHTLCGFPLSFLREAGFSWVEFRKGLIQHSGLQALPERPDQLHFWVCHTALCSPRRPPRPPVSYKAHISHLRPPPWPAMGLAPEGRLPTHDRGSFSKQKPEPLILMLFSLPDSHHPAKKPRVAPPTYLSALTFSHLLSLSQPPAPLVALNCTKLTPTSESLHSLFTLPDTFCP